MPHGRIFPGSNLRPLFSCSLLQPTSAARGKRVARKGTGRRPVAASSHPPRSRTPKSEHEINPRKCTTTLFQMTNRPDRFRVHFCSVGRVDVEWRGVPEPSGPLAPPGPSAQRSVGLTPRRSPSRHTSAQPAISTTVAIAEPSIPKPGSYANPTTGVVPGVTPKIANGVVPPLLGSRAGQTPPKGCRASTRPGQTESRRAPG